MKTTILVILLLVCAGSAQAQDTVFVSRKAVHERIALFENLINQNNSQDSLVVLTLANPTQREVDVLQLRLQRVQLRELSLQYAGAIQILQLALVDSTLWINKNRKE